MSATGDCVDPVLLQGVGQVSVDGLTVSLMGGPSRDDYETAAEFSYLAEGLSAGSSQLSWEASDGVPYVVKKGDNYKLRLQHPDGITVYAVPRKGYKNMPALRVLFPASWCRVVPPSHLEAYAVALGKTWGFQCWESFPSRVDIAVDLPVAVSDLTSGHWKGRSRCGGAKRVYYDTDGNRLSERPDDDKLATVCNQTGGRKPHTFTIYDKTLQSTGRASARWQIEAYRCPSSTLTRVEFQMRRKGLQKQGIDSCADLTPEACATTWSWFTNHLRFEDSSGVTQRWVQVQNAEIHIPRDDASSVWRYGDLVYDAGSRELVDVNTGEVVDLAVQEPETGLDRCLPIEERLAEGPPTAQFQQPSVAGSLPTTVRECEVPVTELQTSTSNRDRAPGRVHGDTGIATPHGLSMRIATDSLGAYCTMPPEYGFPRVCRSRGSPSVEKNTTPHVLKNRQIGLKLAHEVRSGIAGNPRIVPGE